MGVVLVIGVVVLLVILRLNLPEIKGSIGESKAAYKLSKLDSEEYKVINDLLIVNGSRSSQIEIICFSDCYAKRGSDRNRIKKADPL